MRIGDGNSAQTSTKGDNQAGSRRCLTYPEHKRPLDEVGSYVCQSDTKISSQRRRLLAQVRSQLADFRAKFAAFVGEAPLEPLGRDVQQGFVALSEHLCECGTGAVAKSLTQGRRPLTIIHRVDTFCPTHDDDAIVVVRSQGQRGSV